MSPVFKKVGDSANQSARQVTESFARAGESTRRFNVAAAAMGTAIGASVGILADFSRAAAEDAAGQARLQQAIENTGKSYDEYSDSVDKAIKKGQEKAFSDDATREALVRLTSVTGDAGKSLDQLGLVMDFARARGISLADSATVIGKVMGGNVGILQRYGIAIEDGATATEALALIQARSAGQADVYANSQLGQLDKMKDKWAELAESIGANTGELQQFLLLLPGLSAGATALTGLLAGVGGMGAATSALLKYGGPLALVAGGGALAYGYSQDTLGTTQINSFANQFFMVMSQVLNEFLPGNPYDPGKYTAQMSKNAQWDAINSVFAGQGLSQDTIVQTVGRMAGVQGSITMGPNFETDSNGQPQMVSTYTPPTSDQVLAAVTRAAASGNMDLATYILSLSRPFIPTPTGSLVSASMAPTIPYTGPYQPNGGLVNTMSPRYYGDIDTGPKSPTGRAIGGASVNDMSDYRKGPADSATYSADAVREAIIKENEAYRFLFEGVTTADEALQAFTVTQNELGSQMSTYQGQAAEWNSELQAQDAAYEILQERQANGIELTKEQTDFLNNYTHAQEVGTAAVEDATVAAGMAAQSMLLNKESADSFKSSTDDLTDTIRLLIMALDGVPEEVRTQVILDTDPALGSLYNFLGLIPSSVTIPMYVSGTDIGSFLGGGRQLGGIIPGARHGRVMGNGYTLVGEDGPELIAGGRGAGGMVIPAGATRAKMRDKGGNGITIQNMTIIANDPMQFQQQLRSNSLMEGRW